MPKSDRYFVGQSEIRPISAITDTPSPKTVRELIATMLITMMEEPNGGWKPWHMASRLEALFYTLAKEQRFGTNE